MIPYRNLIEALEAAPSERPFVTAWVNEDEQETVTFGEFRRRARLQAGVLRANGVTSGDRVIIIMPQGILTMTVFIGAMILDAVPALIAYPNDKVEPSKYRFGVAGVTANLNAKVVVIDEEFPNEILGHVALGEETRLLRVGDNSGPGREEPLDSPAQRDGVAFI
ncbi:MAG: AMP-binding protein, partial [Candidatus Korobacteraceae bacterium]